MTAGSMPAIEQSRTRRNRRHRFLVVEDEYLIADDIQKWLRESGRLVVGTFPTEEAALKAIGKGGVDGAVLDINLRGMMAFEVARTLEQLAIPFVFATGYGQASIPPEFDYVTRLEKPFSKERFLEAIASL